MAVIATIVFGIALLIQGNGMMSELARFSVLRAGKSSINGFAAGSRSAVILLGAGGIALGVLSLLDFNSAVLTPIASILFGSALVLSSVSVWHLNVVRRASKGEESSRDILANQMAFDCASIQIFGGFAAVMLGVLAASGTRNDLTFNLVALLILGSALVLKGGSLNAILLSFMRSTARRPPTPRV
ncbi:hypothetical protein [Methylocystis suflitae]|uniref:hypothetical protein n=1 Tax=Methylocystis suflitae TaxID=2951405 RepID=UPI0038990567